MIIKTDTDIELNISLANTIVYGDEICFNEWTVFYLDWWEIASEQRQKLIDIFETDSTIDTWSCTYIIYNSLKGEYKLYVRRLDYLDTVFFEYPELFEEYISEQFNQKGITITLNNEEINELNNRKQSEINELYI